MNLREVRREFREVDLDQVDAPVLPSRSQMDDEKMDELARSIKEIGLQQPIVLARVGDRYEVVAGHRRRIACGRAGLLRIPAIVYPSTDVALASAQFAENKYREDLNAADEAIWFTELMERDCGGDTNRLADLLGLKRDYVENRLLLFGGDAVVFEALQAGKIKIGVAHALNQCTEALMRRYYLDMAIRGGATINTVTGWVQQWRASLGPHGVPDDMPSAAVLPSAVPQTDYFRCYVCGGTEQVHLMIPVNVHQHCKLAILDKGLFPGVGEPR
jgi:ParB family chromosome partitioning protein